MEARSEAVVALLFRHSAGCIVEVVLLAALLESVGEINGEEEDEPVHAGATAAVVPVVVRVAGRDIDKRRILHPRQDLLARVYLLRWPDGSGRTHTVLVCPFFAADLTWPCVAVHRSHV